MKKLYYITEMESKKNELMNYIMSLTPEQIKKIVEHLEELKHLVKTEG